MQHPCRQLLIQHTMTHTQDPAQVGTTISTQIHIKSSYVNVLHSIHVYIRVHVKNMYILGLVFGVFGGFITPAFSFILS